MLHNFKYSFKTLFGNKMLVFWTFAFPIILGTFFSMAFSNIEKSEALNIINIGIIDNEEYQSDILMKETFNELGNENSENQLFDIKYATLEHNIELLEEKQIIGYVKLENNIPKIVVNKNGIDETVLKSVVEEITQTKEMIKNLVSNETINMEVSNIINNATANIKDISSNNLSYTMIEFYTLIAMACLYGAMFGMTSINQALPNMSNTGKRISVSPIGKGKLVLSSVLASYLTQLIGIALLLIYTIFVLKVDYGANIPLVILLSLVGSISGLILGVAIGTSLKTNENLKIGIIISVTMLGCFLSGMMGITMKYIIDKNIPLLNKINPANMLTDGFYSLYYYDTVDRFIFNVISLLIFASIMIIISYFSLRRQKYDSI